MPGSENRDVVFPRPRLHSPCSRGRSRTFRLDRPAIAALINLLSLLSGVAREEGISLGMDAPMILHPWSRQTTPRRDEAVDPALWTLVPPNVEGRELREELQLAIREMVMDPPSHCPPVGALSVLIGKPRNDDRGQRAHAAASVPTIPDVAGIVPLVRCATQAMRVAEGVHRRSAIGRTDRQPTKSRLQGLQQLFAKAPPRRDRQYRIIGNIGKPVQISDLAVQEIPHEKGWRKTDATELFEAAH